jgi:ParB family chromosome partitioning protein
MERLATVALEQGLSVRAVEELVRLDGAAKSRRRVRRVDPAIRRVEDALRQRLRTDVRVSTRGKSGRVTINFYSHDDLARILEIVLGEPFDG